MCELPLAPEDLLVVGDDNQSLLAGAMLASSRHGHIIDGRLVALCVLIRDAEEHPSNIHPLDRPANRDRPRLYEESNGDEDGFRTVLRIDRYRVVVRRGLRRFRL
jgi:hypothetical protein